MYLPYQLRVIDESKDLIEKLGALLPFFESPTFRALSAADQVLLRMQAKFMAGYSECLTERILAFSSAH